MEPMPGPSRQNFYYVPRCLVCNEEATGRHYGAYACDACSSFFRRSVIDRKQYTCRSPQPGACYVYGPQRRRCRSCRYVRCLQAGMRPDAVNVERGLRYPHVVEEAAQQADLRNSVEIVGIPPFILPSYYPQPRPRVVYPSPAHDIVFPNPYSAWNRIPYRMPVLPMPNLAIITDEEMTSMCEAAGRLLLANVQWVKNYPAFDALELSHRHSLLRNSWKDLFVFSSVHFNFPLDFRLFLNIQWFHCMLDVLNYLWARWIVLQAEVDSKEILSMRSVLLFTSKEHRLTVPMVNYLYYYAINVLHEYSSYIHPEDPGRALRLILLLNEFNPIPKELISVVFFRRIIGEYPMEDLVVDVYNAMKFGDWYATLERERNGLGEAYTTLFAHDVLRRCAGIEPPAPQ